MVLITFAGNVAVKAAELINYRFFKKSYFTHILRASTNKCTHQNTTHHEYSTRTRSDTKLSFSGSFRTKAYREESKIIINTDSNVLGLYFFF